MGKGRENERKESGRVKEEKARGGVSSRKGEGDKGRGKEGQGNDRADGTRREDFCAVVIFLSNREPCKNSCMNRLRRRLPAVDILNRIR